MIMNSYVGFLHFYSPYGYVQAKESALRKDVGCQFAMAQIVLPVFRSLPGHPFFLREFAVCVARSGLADYAVVCGQSCRPRSSNRMMADTFLLRCQMWA